MRFKIVGANSETGDDVDVVLEAASQPEVEKLAHDKGILVSSIASIAGAPPAHAAAHAPAHPANASHPPASAHASHASAPALANASHAPVAHAAQASGTQAPASAPPAHKPPKEKDFSSIDLVDDEPPAGSDPSKPHERAHGLITVNANAPSETAHTGSGTIEQGKQAESAMEYHVILNQSLFLLESAVNKHLRDGWEPAGGVAVGVSNNAMQFFQGLIRKKKPAGAAGATP